MFLSFDLVLLLAWVFVSAFLPGAILSFSILHKSEFNFLEKLMVGFAIGFVLLPLIPFLLYLLLGIKYTYELALLSVGLLYIISIALFVKNKLHENITLPDVSILKTHGKNFEIQTEHLISLGLLLVLVVTYLIRIGSYGPIFMELDPYFYTYSATQILSVGENPFNDSTAWYPISEVDHRGIPAISYLESVWYSLYTGGGEYNNMLLAAIASTYPPLAAVLAVFFVYLLVSTATKREFGLIAAGLTTFIPVFVYKLAAGEQEVQPYAFFALLFFYAMYFLSIKKKELTYPLLASLAWVALALGSSSQIVALVGVLLFTISYSILVFLRDEDESMLKHLLQINVIIYVIGVLLGSTIIKSFFETGSIYLGNAVTFLIPILFVGILYLVKQKLPKQQQTIALGIILILGLLIYLSPFGANIKDLGRSVFQIAQYNAPLDRTIAEQGIASTVFGSQIGFIAQEYSLSQNSSIFDSLAFLVLVPFSILSNLILSIFVSIINLVLGTSIPYNEKTTSLLLFWFLLFILSSVYSLWRFIQKKDDGLFLFFLAILLPPFIVGLLKAKYTIYAAVLFAIAIGVTIGQAGKVLMESEQHALKSYAPFVIGIGFAFVVLQFAHMGLAPSFLWGSFQTLYQNDPNALASKFTQLCAATKDSEVCAAASDPLGYASLGTNYQYSQKLCMLSIFSSPTYLQDPSKAPPWEPPAAYLRCTRLATYWVDSMEWIKVNLDTDARVISWWDYGHWLNYFGERNAVVRNEHLSHEMIGNVANGYLDSTPEELIEIMKSYGSEYALFDIELVAGGNSLGGKYGALNYLSCAYNNETTVLKSPGESECEAEHLWETIFVSQIPCTISDLTGKTGYTAYKLSVGDTTIPFYPSQCIGQTDQQVIDYCKAVYQSVPTYCVGDATLVTGQTVPATYYLNETYSNGDLKINKAQLGLAGQVGSTAHFGQVTQVTLFYTNDLVWLDNGVIKAGYEDRKGKFYDSNLYRAMFLGEIPGFTLVYSSSDGAVRIFKID
ncbi:MAG: STT3 domain-containing protein [Candidatus Micrarchaeota archaeon]